MKIKLYIVVLKLEEMRLLQIFNRNSNRIEAGHIFIHKLVVSQNLCSVIIQRRFENPVSSYMRNCKQAFCTWYCQIIPTLNIGAHQKKRGASRAGECKIVSIKLCMSSPVQPLPLNKIN